MGARGRDSQTSADQQRKRFLQANLLVGRKAPGERDANVAKGRRSGILKVEALRPADKQKEVPARESLWMEAGTEAKSILGAGTQRDANKTGQMD
jgi:hypothetical protein